MTHKPPTDAYLEDEWKRLENLLFAASQGEHGGILLQMAIVKDLQDSRQEIRRLRKENEELRNKKEFKEVVQGEVGKKIDKFWNDRGFKR